MNTINLICETQGASSVTLALSLVRAICNQKDVLNVQVNSPGEALILLNFKIDYQARFKVNLNRLLLEISECASSKEVYSIQVPEPENSNASERQIVRHASGIHLSRIKFRFTVSTLSIQ